MKYIRKREVVDALQWDPYNMTIFDVMEYFGSKSFSDSTMIYYSDEYKGCLKIVNYKRIMIVKHNDYIVKDEHGSIYGHNQYVFERTYELVEDQGGTGE